VRLQIAEQKKVTGSQVRTVCRVVLLYKAAVANSLCFSGINSLPEKCHKCIELNSDYIEK